MMMGSSPKGRRSAPPKLAKAPLRASMGSAASCWTHRGQAARWDDHHYNETWLVARHGYRTPAKVRADQCRLDQNAMTDLKLAA
jgi:hypothetical protein